MSLIESASIEMQEILMRLREEAVALQEKNVQLKIRVLELAVAP